MGEGEDLAGHKTISNTFKDQIGVVRVLQADRVNLTQYLREGCTHLRTSNGFGGMQYAVCIITMIVLVSNQTLHNIVQ